MNFNSINPLRFYWYLKNCCTVTVQGTGDNPDEISIKKRSLKVDKDKTTIFRTARLKVQETGRVYEVCLKNADQISIKEVTSNVKAYKSKIEPDGSITITEDKDAFFVDVTSFKKCNIAIGSNDKIVSAFKEALTQNQSLRIVKVTRSLKKVVSTIGEKTPACLKSKWVTTPLKAAAFISAGYLIATHYQEPLRTACGWVAKEVPVEAKNGFQRGVESVVYYASCLKFW